MMLLFRTAAVGGSRYSHCWSVEPDFNRSNLESVEGAVSFPGIYSVWGVKECGSQKKKNLKQQLVCEKKIQKKSKIPKKVTTDFHAQVSVREIL